MGRKVPGRDSSGNNSLFTTDSKVERFLRGNYCGWTISGLYFRGEMVLGPTDLEGERK